MNSKKLFSKLPFQKFWARVKNDTNERIESMRFSVPALRVGVLEYAPGQLQTNNAALDGKAVRLYYPPESVSNSDFLKSLETAPVVVGGHESTTGEQNKKIDGWAHSVAYDASAKAAVIAGIVKGAKEVAYIKTNLGNIGFGASAFIDIKNMIVENGVTPDGQTYNAVAHELVATHIALAPNVRDPQNKIRVTNAVVVNSDGEIIDREKEAVKILKSEVLMEAKELAAIVKNAIDEAQAEKSGDDRMVALESAVNEIKETLKKLMEGEEKEAENADAPGEEKPGEEKAATLENAKPSQALVSAFATAYNVDFGAKTPTFETLANLSGVKESDAGARIVAVNAKYSELAKVSVTAKNENITTQGVF